MNKIKLSALILFLFNTLHADTPVSDSFSYKVMCVENFVNCHPHFFNIVKYSAEIGASAFALKSMYAFHNALYAYQKNEFDHFNESVYSHECQKLEPNWFFPWIGQSRKNSADKSEGIKVNITSPCYAPAAICAYLIARGSYGICKELYSFAQECMNKKPLQK